MGNNNSVTFSGQYAITDDIFEVLCAKYGRDSDRRCDHYPYITIECVNNMLKKAEVTRRAHGSSYYYATSVMEEETD